MDNPNPQPLNAAHASYLLGFSPSAERLQPTEMALLSQVGIEHCDIGSLTAWYKLIERSDFEGPIAEKNLADIQWLTPRVLAHEAIVSQISQRIPLYPSRFGALFSSLDRIREIASLNALGLQSFFQRIRGKSEWGIKFFGDSARMAVIVAERDGILQAGKATNGVNYLKLRQMQRAHTISAAGVFQSQVALAKEALTQRYQDLVSRPILNTTKTSTNEQLLGNLAILVRGGESDDLIAWASDWNEVQFTALGMRAQVTGPWPAYSFCPKLIDLSERTEAA